MPCRARWYIGMRVMSSPSSLIRPTMWRDETDEHVERRRLAGAVRTEQPYDLALAEAECDIVHHAPTLVHLDESFGRQLAPSLHGDRARGDANGVLVLDVVKAGQHLFGRHQRQCLLHCRRKPNDRVGRRQSVVRQAERAFGLHRRQDHRGQVLPHILVVQSVRRRRNVAAFRLQRGELEIPVRRGDRMQRSRAIDDSLPARVCRGDEQRAQCDDVRHVACGELVQQFAVRQILSVGRRTRRRVMRRLGRRLG